MQKNKKATSIVEAMVIMLIVVSWVTWMYSIYNESIKLSNSTENKIQAIQIAKQWIEAFTNIRDTNWIIFPSDYKNCWNTMNYNPACIWDPDPTNKITNSLSYIIFQNNLNRWELLNKTSDNYWSGTYINDFRVWFDDKWIYTQSWITDILKGNFIREIKVSYLNDSWAVWDENDNKIKVISLVQWVDSASKLPHKVELEQILTNYKK